MEACASMRKQASGVIFIIAEVLFQDFITPDIYMFIG
jgi:hypothetical protein